MSKYPLLVRGYKSDEGTIIICASCESEAKITINDFSGDATYSCPQGCGGIATFKYAEADPCPNCGKLGFYEHVLKHCCSRPCMLQFEYAKQLAESRA